MPASNLESQDVLREQERFVTDDETIELKKYLHNGLSKCRWNVDGSTIVYTRLVITGLQLKSLNFLKSHQNIQSLILHDNNLTDVSALCELRYLVSVDLSGNRLTHTPELIPAPSNLQEMDLSRNQITCIGDMSIYRYLRRLCLDRNLIKQIQGLQGCKYLTDLSLRNNGITKVENLEYLPLKTLDLRNNRIKTLEALKDLPELQELHLSNNYVNCLSGVEDHPYLTFVDLENNNISDVEELQYLQALPSLKYLTFRRNRLNSQLHQNAQSGVQSGLKSSPCLSSRLFIIYILPSLKVLDGLPISPEEKVAAQNYYDPPADIISSVNHAIDVQQSISQYARIRASDLALSTRYRPIVLAGSSGVGKRTLTQRLLEELPHIFGLCVSHTTRTPRPGEEHGVHYHFVSKEEMQHMAETGQFVEIVTFFGHWYANSFDAIFKVALEGKICIMDLEIEGVLALKRSIMNPRYIYISPPSYDVLQERLENRIVKQKKRAHEIQEVQKVEEEEKRLARQKEITSKVTDKPLVSFLDSDDGMLMSHGTHRGFTEMEGKESDAGDQLVAQWLEKAQKTTKQGTLYHHEAVYADYVNDPGFFDLIIVNDNLDEAYGKLKNFALENLESSDGLSS